MLYKKEKRFSSHKMDMQISHCICKGIFNHTSLCEYHQGKLLVHLTIPFEEKPAINQPGENLRYYRVRSNMTTGELATILEIAPATLLAYEQNRNPIPYDIAISAAKSLAIDVTLLFDAFTEFISTPHTVVLQRIRTELQMNQRQFAEYIGVLPSYYYKLESGNRKPSPFLSIP
ncbi:helix-turn-helix transcriptional regulator [uncultured Robinsoniella sp.]|uniref:helix-turn-helix transcriptional regulator n=1 Tax=uncultured Robinsoniella sp. TaxID=904190 RepID=UPI00374E7B9D